MAAKSVLMELDQLRSMLQPDGTAHSTSTPSTSKYSRYRSYAASHGTQSADRLGRAIEAAEEEMEAALQRTNDMHKAQLKVKDIEIAELQRVVVAMERDVDALRDTLSTAKRSNEQKLSHLESLVASKDTEVSTLHAEVLALRAERDELQRRCQQAIIDLNRVDDELRERTVELSSCLRLRAEEAGQAAGLATRERKQKELLSLEVTELRKELEASEADLAAARQEAAAAHNRAQAEHHVCQDLQAALGKAQAAAAVLKESKDLEIAELRRRLKAEHGVRKACERWLKSELQSREEMEGLLLTVRDMALGRGHTAAGAGAAAEIEQIQALLDALDARPAAALSKHQQQGTQQRHQQHGKLQRQQPLQQQQQQQEEHGRTSSPHKASSTAKAALQMLHSEHEANKHQQEFAQLKAMLGKESKRLRDELLSAKQLLQGKAPA